MKSGQKEGAVELDDAEFGALERREGRGEMGRVSGLGAPLPSRLSGQGSRPGRSAGPGRLASFLGSDPGVRAAPPPTTMEAEADTATAAVALHRRWSQAGLTGAGLFPMAFRRLHTGSPLRLQKLAQDRWLSAVRPETSARFRPERVGGDTLAAPGPPPARRGRPCPAPSRPAPPAAAPPTGPLWGCGGFGACPARDPARSWLTSPSPRAEALLSGSWELGMDC